MAAGQVVCPFFGVVFEKLGDLIKAELSPLHCVEKDLKNLYQTLSGIKHVLSDAEEKQFKEGEEAIRFWLQELNDAAYKADDIMDVFECEGLQLLASEEMSSNNMVTSSPQEINFHRKVRKDIKKLIKMFHAISKEALKLDLQKGNVKKRFEETYPGRESSSILSEPRVYGRDQDKEEILKLLLGDDYLPLGGFRAPQRHPRGQSDRPLLSSATEDISICSILGIGGLGKTTLAQLVYNDERVAKHFEVKSWVCVSDDFDVKRLLKSIIASVSGTVCVLDELESLQLRLQRELACGKRFLLVLDDVWDVNQQEWNKLKVSLKNGVKGSSVIVTTRLETVASITGTVPPRRLNVLSKGHCWALFKQYAFGLGNEMKPALVKIGKEIVDKCGGLPLAAKALGGLLRFENDENEWNAVKESEVWELPQSSENNILPALKLSYDNLPSMLKQCFAYCSIFPKDHEIEKDKLIKLWMANGLVPSQARIQLEDTGNAIFTALLWRSFFQDVKKDEDTCIETCKMHDLVHDLACYIAGNEYFIEDVGSAGNISKRTRHVSLLFDSEVLPSSSLEPIQRFSPYLRSLIRLNEDEVTLESEIVFSRFMWLRALDLNSSSIEVVPDSIGEMIHLRYLNLAANPFTSLPESICLLRNVQTLNLRDCEELESLPKDMRKMSSLRHLDIIGCVDINSMPIGMGQLTCLQSLTVFIVGMESGRAVNELRDLNLGGELVIKGLEHVKTKTEAEAANLIRKKNIHSLMLKWSDSEYQLQQQQQEDMAVEVIEGLQPHTNETELLVLGMKSDCGVDELQGLDNVTGELEIRGTEHLKNSMEAEDTNFMRKKNLPTLQPAWSVSNSHSDSDSDYSPLKQDQEENWRQEEEIEGLQPHTNERELLLMGMERDSGVDELQGLDNVTGELEIRDIEHLETSMESEATNLMRKKNLPTSKPAWSVSDSDSYSDSDSDSYSQLEQCQQETWRQKEVIESLQPHSNVRALAVQGYQGLTFPSWLTASCVPNLVEIYLSDCTRCECLPLLGKLPLLKSLHLEEMNSLKFIDLDDEVYGGETVVFPSLQELTLEFLELEEWSSSLQSQATAIEVAVFPSLKTASVTKCSSLKGVPFSWSPVQSVEMSRCNGMVLGSLQDLHSLVFLKITELYYLEYFPEGALHNLIALQELVIIDCDNLKALPVELKSLTTLKKLEIKRCSKLVSLEVEGGLRNLSSLETLEIGICDTLKCLPELEKSSLIRLCIHSCPQMEFSTEDFEHLVVLEDLKLRGLPKLTCFPEGIKHAPMLRSLYIGGCSEDYEIDLPDWIGSLTSLETLYIEGCKNQEVLPEGMKHLTALEELYIYGCNEELERKWKDKHREDWFNMISHVQDVEISSTKSW